MGTTLQATAFLPECRSVMDNTGSTSNCARSVYHRGARENGYSGHDIEKVRQTIIEHESIFRNQLQELHRLYRRQKELMNEIKSYNWKGNCLPVVSPNQDTGRLRNLEPRFLSSWIFPKGTDKVIGVPCDTYTSSHQVSYKRSIKLSLAAAPISQQRTSNALGFDFYSKSTTKIPGDLSVTKSKDIISDELTLSSGAKPVSGFNLTMNDFYQNSVQGMNGKSGTSLLGLRNIEKSGKEHIFENYVEKGRFDRHSSVEDLFCSGKPLLAEPRKELSNCSYPHTSVSRKKKKIFGVEISEGDVYPLNATSNFSTTLDMKIGLRQENHRIVSFNKPSSWVSSSYMQNIDLAGKNVNDARNVPYQLTASEPGKCFMNSVDVNSKPVDFQSNHEKPKNGLPWFLKNSQVSGDLSKGNKNSYAMNLDSLQSYSEKFFRKDETAEGKCHTLKQKTEIIIGGHSARKVEMVENAQMKQVETKNGLVLHTGLNSKCIPNMSRHHIDLNLSLDDEDASLAPSLSTAVEKIATAGTDLEVHPVVEPKASYEECDKFAADTIIDISSLSTKRNLRNEGSCDHLKWFADIISLDQNGHHDDQVGSIPDGVDDFEFMTLRLEDVKEEHFHESVLLETPISDTLTPKRSRRGRQRKRDFQRDILPGLVTLSRLEITEDFQAFQQLMKAEGGPRAPSRNGRGRKRLGGRDVSPPAKLLGSGCTEQTVCQPKGRSLTGWGRRTRRLPRQRCASAFIDFSVKCRRAC